jgi:hypothetical protein
LMERSKIKGKAPKAIIFVQVVVLIGNSSLLYFVMNGEDYILLKAVEPF